MVRLSELNPPKIIEAKVYWWNTPSKARERRAFERRAVEEVKKWLEQVSTTYNLQLELENDDHCVVAYKDKKEVARFSLWCTCTCIRKHRRFRELLKLIEERR